jgi:hypothetical protein
MKKPSEPDMPANFSQLAESSLIEKHEQSLGQVGQLANA